MRRRDPDHWFERFQRTGDPGALGRLFDLTAPELLCVACYLVGDRHAAEDLVQATFLVAIEDAGSHDQERRVMPWLLGILANRARELRKARARTPDPERVPRPEPSDPTDDAARAEFHQTLAKALAELPAPYGEVLRLHLDHGLTAQEIAAALQRPPGTVRTQVVRGMEILRAALPAGFATTGFLVATSAQGLAAVRQAVLARVPEPVLGAAMTSGLLAGALAMKKLMVALGVALATAALWMAWPDPPAVRRDQAANVSTPAPVASLPVDAAPPAHPGPDPNATTSRAAVADAPATGSLHLTILWADDGAPAADLDFWHSPLMGDRRAGETKLERTDARGTATLAALPPGQRTVSVCRATEQVTVVAGTQTRATLRVKPWIVMEGLVVDAAGASVAGAAVRTCGLEPRTLTSTGGDGRFAWRGGHVGEVWAEAEGLLPSRLQRVPEPKDTPAVLRFELGAAGTLLIGRVLDARGEPAGGALVMVSVDEDLQRPILSDGKPAWNVAPLMLRADSGGRFRTHSVPPGEHTLAASAPGSAPNTARILVTEATEPVTIRLRAGATVRGTVRDAQGRPVGASLSAAHAGGIRGLWPYYRALDSGVRAATDGSGRFELQDVWPGEVRLWCAPWQGTGPGLELMVTLTEGQEFEWNPVPPAAVILAGRVVDPQGRPLPGWRVKAWPLEVAGAKVHPEARTDPDGTFTLAGITAGSYLVWTLPDGLTGAAKELPWAAAHATTGMQDVTLRVPVTQAEAGWFTGRVLGAEGQQTGAASLQLQKVTFFGMQHEQVIEAGGMFRVGPLPPGEYTLGFRAAGRNWTSFARTLPAGATVDLGLVRLVAMGSLTVTVRAEGGGKVEDAELKFVGTDGYISAPFSRTAEGSLRAEAPPGPLTLEVWGPTIVRSEHQLEIKPGADTALTVTAARAQPVRFLLVQPAPRREHWTDGVRLTVRDARGDSVESFIQVNGGETFPWMRGLSPGSYTFAAQLWRGRSGDSAVEGSFVVREGAGGPVEVRVEFPEAASGR